MLTTLRMSLISACVTGGTTVSIRLPSYVLLMCPSMTVSVLATRYPSLSILSYYDTPLLVLRLFMVKVNHVVPLMVLESLLSIKTRGLER